MTSSPELVLVTGASGFLGSHIVNELLKDGYNVRAVARSAKVATLRERYAVHGARVQVFGVDDLVTGNFEVAFAGVNALIHVASPLAGKMDARGTLDVAVKGALNVVSQAASAGVKKIVLTSSYAALVHPGKRTHNGDVITEQDWSDVTEQEVIKRSESPFFVYLGSKALSEKALWAFADTRPELDVTTILPPFLYGPLAPGFTAAPHDIGALSTDVFFWQLLFESAGGPVPALPTSFFVDVRDAARAHVLALRSPPASKVGRKRIIAAGGAFAWPEVVEHLLKVRPELAARLPDPKQGGTPRIQGRIDTSRAREVLGIKKFHGWERTVEDTVDDLLRVEAEWNRARL